MASLARLEAKTAVITGAAGGIGRAAVALFAEEGANVLAVDVDEEALDAAVAEVASNRVGRYVADVARAADNERMFATASERYGGVDVFLANAGIEGAVAPIVDMDEADFDRVLAVNVKGVWLGLKYGIPHLAKRGGGSIVITSSVAGLTPTPNIAPYGASKHAVIGLMRAAARECAAANIRVNTVNPAPVETRMMRSLERGMAPDDPEAARQRIAQSIPLGRYAQPLDIAKVMLFLASDDAAFITGSVYKADGGSSQY